MTDDDRDTLMRMAAFENVRRLNEVRDNLSARERPTQPPRYLVIAMITARSINRSPW